MRAAFVASLAIRTSALGGVSRGGLARHGSSRESIWSVSRSLECLARIGAGLEAESENSEVILPAHRVHA